MGDIDMAKEEVKAESNEESDGDEEEYEIESIIKKRKQSDGAWEYFVKWKGYDDSDNTWEPQENLESSAKEMLKTFNEKSSKKRGRKAAEDNDDEEEEQEEAQVGYHCVPPSKLEKILGARKEPGSQAVQFLCKWEGTEITSLEYSSRVKTYNHEDALKVIAFYEERLRFGSSDDKKK